MRKIRLIGIGMGNPGYVALKAVAAIGQRDVLFVPARPAEVAGPLLDVRDRIEELRAAARARHGWIADVYLLRRIG